MVDNNPIAGLEAALDGFRVAQLEDTLEFGQVFITVTGWPNAIVEEPVPNVVNIEVASKMLKQLSHRI